MSTGAKFDDAVTTAYEAFKMTSNKGRFMTFVLDNSGNIVIEKISEARDFQSFVDALTEGAVVPRYSVFKLEYTSKDGRPCEKVVNVSW